MTGKIAICYASSGAGRDIFTRSLYRFARYDASHRNLLLDDVCVGVGPYIDLNENTMVHQALKTDAEWIFSIETDVGFHETVPYHLLDIADPKERPIVTGVVVGRRTDIKEIGATRTQIPMFFLKDEPTGLYKTVGSLVDEPVRIDAAGLGCVMIHRSVFEAFHRDGPRPWFRCGTYPDGVTFKGQDIYFYEECQKLGFSIWGSATAPTIHEKTEYLTIQTLTRDVAFAHLRELGG